MKTKTKKIFSLSVLVILCIAVFGLVGAVSAEDSIEDILNTRYGSECWQNTTVETFYATGTSSSYTATAIVVDAQCGYTNPTGWYDATTLVKSELWHNPKDDICGAAKPIGPLGASKDFGLYIEPNENVESTYYTETSLNPNEGTPPTPQLHAKVYQITCGPIDADYVVAFEDKSPDDDTPWDEDYNDVVIELRDASSEPIPEFATIAIPAIAVLGLFLFSNKRKHKKE